MCTWGEREGGECWARERGVSVGRERGREIGGEFGARERERKW